MVSFFIDRMPVLTVGQLFPCFCLYKSTFIIYFPKTIEKNVKTYRTAPTEKNPTGREIILMVEDERAILRLAKRRLEQLGYTVFDFFSPKEAIENYNKLRLTVEY